MAAPTTDGDPRRIRTHSNNTTPPPSPPELRSLSPPTTAGLPTRDRDHQTTPISRAPTFLRLFLHLRFFRFPPFSPDRERQNQRLRRANITRAPVRDPFLASSTHSFDHAGCRTTGIQAQAGLPRNTCDAHFLANTYRDGYPGPASPPWNKEGSKETPYPTPRLRAP